MGKPVEHPIPNANDAQIESTTGSTEIPSLDRGSITDVSALLRPSTRPWLMFDRPSRRASQLSVGEVLPVARGSVLPTEGFFAVAEARATNPSMPSLHPLTFDASYGAVPTPSEADLEIAEQVPAVVAPPQGRPARSAVGMTFGIAGVAMAIGAAAFVIFAHASARASDPAPAAAAARGTAVVREALVIATPVSVSVSVPVTEASPARAAAGVGPELTKPTATTAAASGAAEAVSPPVVPEIAKETAAAPAAPAAPRKFAKLWISGPARSNHVFLDGKRLLGTGARSFMIFCGGHTIAIGTREDAHEVDIPCNGEFVVNGKPTVR